MCTCKYNTNLWKWLLEWGNQLGPHERLFLFRNCTARKTVCYISPTFVCWWSLRGGSQRFQGAGSSVSHSIVWYWEGWNQGEKAVKHSRSNQMISPTWGQSFSNSDPPRSWCRELQAIVYWHQWNSCRKFARWMEIEMENEFSIPCLACNMFILD